MESLNLNTLVSSLPSQQNAEKELLNDFKAAALSITTLYRSSRKNAERAYNAGYATACQDLLNFIQHGVSTGEPLNSSMDGTSNSSVAVEGGGMTIGRVMGWAEARLHAIKVAEEDEDEDEEKEKEKERAGRSRTSTSRGAPNGVKAEVQQPQLKKPAAVNAAASTSRIFPSVSTLPTPCSPIHTSNPQQAPEQPSSPSPPPARTLHGSHPYQPRQGKVRTPSKSDSVMIPFVTQSPSTSVGGAPALNASGPVTASDAGFSHPPQSPLSVTMPDTSMAIGAGAKRRHAMMMMMEGGSSGTVPSPTTDVFQRRRTRSTRGMHAHYQVNPAAGEGDMDVEEDGGRERKRVARR